MSAAGTDGDNAGFGARAGAGSGGNVYVDGTAMSADEEKKLLDDEEDEQCRRDEKLRAQMAKGMNGAASAKSSPYQ